MTTITANTGKIVVKRKNSRDDIIMRSCMITIGIVLAFFILLPLWAMLSKSFENGDGLFVGLANYAHFFSSPSLFYSIYNSLTIAIISTLILLIVTFLYAYGLTRTCMPGKKIFRLIALIPLLTPSLLPGISLTYWFGNQGIAKELLFGASIYGPIGIVLGSCYWVFPHALMLMITTLSMSDARLYEAADVLATSRIRTFFTVTLPGIKYGLISTIFVVFTYVFTDFGVPTVIGGNYNVLATDIYKQVVGQQNFQMGAVISVVLLAPAAIAFIVDRVVQRKQIALLSAKSVPLIPKENAGVDRFFFIFCSLVSLVIFAVIGMAQYAALIKFWPYDLSFTLGNYNFELTDGGGWDSFYNSLRLGLYAASIGSVIIFFGAYLVEKGRGFVLGRTLFHVIAILPLAVPGMVLGLAYIFFFNDPANPLHGIYGTMTILVICTIVHFYTVSHLTAITALQQMDKQFEAVSASLKAPFYKTFFQVTVPICAPALLEIFIYLFLNAMTTVSALVFLYSSDTTLAAIAVLNMDDAGDVAPAAAMALVIAYTCVAAKIFHSLAASFFEKRTQNWRKK